MCKSTIGSSSPNHSMTRRRSTASRSIGSHSADDSFLSQEEDAPTVLDFQHQEEHQELREEALEVLRRPEIIDVAPDEQTDAPCRHSSNASLSLLTTLGDQSLSSIHTCKAHVSVFRGKSASLGSSQGTTAHLPEERSPLDLSLFATDSQHETIRPGGALEGRDSNTPSDTECPASPFMSRAAAIRALRKLRQDRDTDGEKDELSFASGDDSSSVSSSSPASEFGSGAICEPNDGAQKEDIDLSLFSLPSSPLEQEDKERQPSPAAQHSNQQQQVVSAGGNEVVQGPGVVEQAVLGDDETHHPPPSGPIDGHTSNRSSLSLPFLDGSLRSSFGSPNPQSSHLILSGPLYVKYGAVYILCDCTLNERFFTATPRAQGLYPAVRFQLVQLEEVKLLEMHHYYDRFMFEVIIEGELQQRLLCEHKNSLTSTNESVGFDSSNGLSSAENPSSPHDPEVLPSSLLVSPTTRRSTHSKKFSMLPPRSENSSLRGSANPCSLSSVDRLNGHQAGEGYCVLTFKAPDFDHMTSWVDELRADPVERVKCLESSNSVRSSAHLSPLVLGGKKALQPKSAKPKVLPTKKNSAVELPVYGLGYYQVGRVRI